MDDEVLYANLPNDEADRRFMQRVMDGWKWDHDPLCDEDHQMWERNYRKLET